MKSSLIVLLLSLSLPVISSEQEPLTTFETDYCTGFVEGTVRQPDAWKHCCLEHDMFFWAGGSADDRKLADLNLKSCVEESGHDKYAKVIYYAVRIGSYSPIKFSDKKWNFAWPARPTHQSLTSSDIDRLEESLFQTHPEMDPVIKQKFIQNLRARETSL